MSWIVHPLLQRDQNKAMESDKDNAKKTNNSISIRFAQYEWSETTTKMEQTSKSIARTPRLHKFII